MKPKPALMHLDLAQRRVRWPTICTAFAGLFGASGPAAGLNNRAMKPTALQHSDQVVAHVVAWHNRHPLARRITPEQVHSVGVVSLPYAVRGARALPQVAAAPAQAVEPPLEPAAPDTAVAAAAPEPVPADPIGAAADADTEVAIEAVVEFEPDALEGDAAAAAETPAPPPDGSPDGSLDKSADDPSDDPPADLPADLMAALNAEPAIAAAPGAEAGSAQPAAPAVPAAAGPVLPDRPAELPPRPRPWHPVTWLQRLQGRLPFHALFSEDFIAPMRPRRVRPWVARHGVGQRPLESQAPQRVIVLDAARRRTGDTATEVDLHVITAAIGADDSRHRLLLSPDGAVLGRRLWSPPRLAAAAGSLGAVLALAGGGWAWQAGARGDAVLARAKAASAPAVAKAASSASSALAASAPAVVSAAASAASTSAASSTSAAPVVAVAAPAAASTAPAAPEHAASAVTVAAHAPPEAATPAEAASAPEPVAAPPRYVNPRRGRVDLPPLVPRLDDAQRQQARLSSRELRREPAVLPDAKAWALVTAPLVDRRQSERVAAQLHAVALLQPMPMRAELMPAGKGWRAVFWPFPTAQDAEKVRLALADKGLRTEVLEF